MSKETLRTVIITGGNTGLGFACAASLLTSSAEPAWHVVLACRDQAKARDAVEKLGREAGSRHRVEAMPLDLASLNSIRDFAATITERLEAGSIPPLHGLVCNAGVEAGTELTVTADGFESTFGINHLGHFLFVNLLLLHLSIPARIAVVASGVHDPANKFPVPAPAWNNPELLAKGELGPAATKDGPFASGPRRYSTSKLANIYFTYALAAHLPSGVTVNAFDPGLMPGTGLMREAPLPIRFIATHVFPRIIPLLRRAMSPNVHTAEESGAALAMLLNDPALAGTTGQYFEGQKEIRSSAESYDEERATKLWDDSKRLVNLTPNEYYSAT